jgi:recombination protein RecR
MDGLKKLPGIGARSAERIAFYLLKADREEALGLARAIKATKDEIRPCARCYNIADQELCHICRDHRRDQSQIVVVEQPKDLLALEATGLITGVYHVLMGHISPLEKIEPGDLTIDALLRRVKAGGVREVVLATNPTVEGDATALYISSLLAPDQAEHGQGLADAGVTVTRLARGIAPGSPIEYANRAMLEEAFRGRREA